MPYLGSQSEEQGQSTRLDLRDTPVVDRLASLQVVVQGHHVTNGRGSTDVLQHVLALLVALLPESDESIVGLVDVGVEPLALSRVGEVAADLKESATDGAVPESGLLGARPETLDLRDSTAGSSRVPAYTGDR